MAAIIDAILGRTLPEARKRAERVIKASKMLQKKIDRLVKALNDHRHALERHAEAMEKVVEELKKLEGRK